MREASGRIPHFNIDMRIRTIGCALLLLNACLVPPEENPDASVFGGGAGGGFSGNGGGTGGGGGGSQRCIEVQGLNQTVCAMVAPVVCGGQACASGETCCQTTGACVAAGSSSCPNRPTTYPYVPNARSCGSNADCGPLEFCAPDDATRCIANSGHCHPIDNCGYCGPIGHPMCQVCGCNGVTYESMQAACVAGAPYARRGPCGGAAPVVTDIACGRDDQCPSGAQCCFRTGSCFPSSEPWRCELQPDGSILNCTTDSECNRGTGGSGGSDSFCGGDTCGSSPGRCLGRGSISNCGGEVRTVCGCDGTTYVNDCWARVGGTRVAHAGSCP